MGGFTKMDGLAAKRGYTYRLTRRQFLVASSAAALAACAPAAVTPGARGSPSAAPGKELKIGQLLLFTGVYAELGNFMRRTTELYLRQNDQKLANPPENLLYEDDTKVTATGF